MLEEFGPALGREVIAGEPARISLGSTCLRRIASRSCQHFSRFSAKRSDSPAGRSLFADAWAASR